MLPFVMLADTFIGLLLSVSLYLAIYVLMIKLTIKLAREEKNYSLNWYNRWHYYLIVIVLLALISDPIASWVRKTRLEAFKISSSSMQPTLISGDHIMTTNNPNEVITYGDVVVIVTPSSPNTKIVKRVIAIGGDAVELKGNNLTINGDLINEPYTQYLLGGKWNFQMQKVPDGKYLLFGDNRDQSQDSRFWSEPFIDRDQIVGKVKYVYWNSLFDLSHVGKSIK